MVTARSLKWHLGCLSVCSVAFVVACIVFLTSDGKISARPPVEMKSWMQGLKKLAGMNRTDLVSEGKVPFTWRPFYSRIDRQSMPRQPVPGLTHNDFKRQCRLDAPCISVATRWYGSYNDWGHITRYFYPQNCPHRCDFVSDVSEADAVVFSGWDLPAKPLAWRRHPRQVWVYFNVESPPNNKKNGYDPAENPAYHTLFNWTATYQKDSIAWTPYRYIEPRPVPVAASLPNLQLKKRLAYMVFSNCNNTFNNRIAVVSRLRAVMDLDLYGKCGNYPLPRSEDAFVQLGKKYYFYLSFENSLCQEYISEKLFRNALGTDAAPVAIGGLSRKEYEAVAPPNSFVYGLDFKTAKELAEYLRRLAADTKAYMALFAWRATYQVKMDSFLCGTCRALYKTMPKMLSPNAPKQMVSHLSSYYSIEKFCRPEDFAYLI